MASDNVAYLAMSLDGFLAGPDGSVSFLDDFASDDYGFHDFVAGVGALAMGSTTYEQVLGVGWPYGTLPTLVLTSRDLPKAEGADITFSSEPTGDAIRSFAETTDGRLWIVGGGKVVADGLNAGAIDTIELYVMPLLLGGGTPIAAEAFDGLLTLRESNAFSNGVVKLTYAT